MPIHPSGLSMVVMICASQPSNGGESIQPIGTACFVGVPGAVGLNHWYLVTARHVITYASKRYGQLYVRVRLTDEGTYEAPHELSDLPVSADDWVMGETSAEDIAVMPFPWRPDLQHRCWGSPSFLSEEDNVPYAGEAVYFIGLLSFVPEMAANNVPMVRSGTVGALGQTGIPVVMPDRVRTRITGHLIDCRAYRGFSSSPCFVQDPLGKTRRRRERSLRCFG